MSQHFGVIMLILCCMSLSGCLLSVVILLQLARWFQAFLHPVCLWALPLLYSAHEKDRRNGLLDEDESVSVTISFPSPDTEDFCIELICSTDLVC